MRRTAPRSLLGAALLLVGATITLAPALAPAYAATCTSTDVTVLVQFPDRTEVGCAKGDPSTGYEALQKAGFATLVMRQGSGVGAICRINGYPSDNPCTSMPPSDAYWAYFHAAPGGSWTYSTRGGGSYNPKPGTVEGWRFGGGEKPSGNAPAVSTPAPPKPTAKPASKPTKKPASKPTAAVDAPDATATATATGTPTGAPSATATDGATDGGTDAASAAPTPDASSTPDAEAAKPVSSNADDSGSDDDGGLSWVWGLVLLGVLGAAGTGVVISRRQG